METGEERIRQEDCSEDSLGSGILTLTNRRLAFDKSRGRIMDFSKKFDDTVMDVPLRDIARVWKEGRLIKKVCFAARGGSPSSGDGQGQKTYKFGVFSTGDWLESIQDALEDYRSQ